MHMFMNSLKAYVQFYEVFSSFALMNDDAGDTFSISVILLYRNPRFCCWDQYNQYTTLLYFRVARTVAMQWIYSLNLKRYKPQEEKSKEMKVMCFVFTRGVLESLMDF